MTDFKARSNEPEMMDDLSIDDERLTKSLDQLRWFGWRLGGYSATMSVLGPFMKHRAGLPTRILDVGAGMGDFAEYLMLWATKRRLDLHVTAIDINPAVVGYANSTLDGRLPHAMRDRVQVEAGDALKLRYRDDSFDVAISSLFLHHLHGDDCVKAVAQMNRVAKHGIVVNDLQRSPITLAAFKLLGAVFPMTPMIRHDGAVSICRAFTGRELLEIAKAAHLQQPKLRWKSAFRWVLSTLK